MHNLHNFSFSAIPFAIGAIGGCSCIRGGLCNRLNKIEFNAFIDILLCEHLRMCRGVFRTFTILCWNNAVQDTTETNCIKLYPDIWWQQCWGSKYELKHKSKDKSKDKSKYKYCDNSDVESVGVTWCRLAFDSLPHLLLLLHYVNHFTIDFAVQATFLMHYVDHFYTSSPLFRPL